MTTTQIVSAPTAEQGTVRHTSVLLVLLSATFMGQFDFFVVNVAAPSLRADLHTGDALLELIIGGYAFAYAAGLITGGRLGDLFGHRRLFVTGMSAFAATSLLCGLCVTPAELVAARLAQGLAAALMLPQVLALITATVEASARPRAMAWYGVASGVGSIAGQVLGGLLLTSDVLGLGWRLIFVVNVPVGAVAAVLGSRLLPARTGSGRAALDPLGALGFAVTLALLLVPLTLGRTVGWAWWTWAAMALAVPAAAATLHWQRTLQRRGRSPLLDLDLLRARSFRLGLLANSAFMLFFAGYMFVLTLLLQAGLGLSPFAAGLAFVPSGVTFSLTALAGRRLVARYGARVTVLGSIVTGAGLGALLAIIAVDGSHAGAVWVALAASVTGVGNGLIVPSIIGAALADVPGPHAGAAAGALTTAQQFAASAGVAVLGTVFFTAGRHRTDGPAYGTIWSVVVEAALMVCVGAVIAVGARRA